MRRNIEDRMKEHQGYTRLRQPEKSAIAEHCTQHKHTALWDQTEILKKIKHFWDKKIHEALFLRTHRPSINRDDGYHFPDIWLQLLNAAQQQPEPRANQRTASTTQIRSRHCPKLTVNQRTASTTYILAHHWIKTTTNRRTAFLTSSI